MTGLTCPERLAEGATIGPPKAAISAQRHGMRRDAQRDARKPGAGELANPAARQGRRDERQRSRPETLGQALRGRRQSGLAQRGVERGDMGDERIEARPALGGIDPRDRRRRGGVGAEPIDGLGRKGDEPALAQSFGGALDRGA